MKFYRSIKTIKAITFDLDDTLYDNVAVIVKMEQELLAWFKEHYPVVAQMSAEDWRVVKRRLLQEKPALKHDVTLLRFVQIQAVFLSQGYSSLQANQIAQQAVELALEWRNRVTIAPENIALLQTLAEKVPLVAITNGNVDCKKIGLTPYFQYILRAGPDGAAKPDKDMFQKAQQFLALPADNILHVGDHLISDVKGAISANFASCWLNNTGYQIRSLCHGGLLPDMEVSQLASLARLVEG
ncbi:5-amino-6-(5-phospho-D-ribitylamino)uracil phosphatase YigB [Vibrio sagamiensis]|uniref:2-haloalkanoic acid dehalogenase n=1 Tax=Vibrio sagamiensis NBRC 104589 TaxID=1219064 RepID=A0A511QHX5_9VIBR|nr:5-amino-6-(5-phospho-D-ribitylamino)uracil phosphatase YigB [Vibrio sagamiensis]PNQ68347.1 2-haloalkanoic acid dehalogenase [Vibrio agarivorans]GEM76891.1 2-haloalkanoic acid dehalogenase [Vibrio sagamiensis NBRC 104589]